jgi:hypothetical protein
MKLATTKILCDGPTLRQNASTGTTFCGLRPLSRWGVHSNKNAHSELFVCIVIRAQEMKRNVRLVANNPAIVARSNVKNVARLHRV